MKQLCNLNINGEAHELYLPVHKTPLEALREELHLTGTKHGCELGECGLCTVLVDGQAVLSCLTLPITIQDQAITTVEGLASDGRLHPLQQAFADSGASHCPARSGSHDRHFNSATHLNVGRSIGDDARLCGGHRG